jgi:O-antigen/teichoic acid export membrane protein
LSHLNVRTGTAYLLVAQIIFFISAYAMHIFLGRYLGPVAYGLFGVVLYASTIVHTFVASGLPMAVSRYISAEPEKTEAIFQRGLQLQFCLAISISLVFFITAPWIAHLLGDDTLAPLFKIVAPITTFYGVFILIIQYYNGKRHYGVQSLWLMLSYVLRAGCVIGLAVLGFRVYGAVFGLVIAIGISCFLILMTRQSEEKGKPFSASKMMHFSVPLFFASIGHAFLVNLDLMFVKNLVPGAASAGYYTSAKAMANVIPFAFFALSVALYPAVSNVYSSGDMTSLRDYIRKANRLLLQVVLPVFIMVSLNSKGILRLIYGVEYLAAAPVLCWLMLAFCMLAIFIIHKSIITGCGFPWISSAITLMLLPVFITLQVIFIPVYGLVGAAIASVVTFSIGMISSTIIVFLKFKAGFYVTSTIRIFLAALFILVIDLILAKFGVLLIPKLIIIGFIYLLILRLLGELQPDQLRELAGEFIGGIKRGNNIEQDASSQSKGT